MTSDGPTAPPHVGEEAGRSSPAPAAPTAEPLAPPMQTHV